MERGRVFTDRLSIKLHLLLPLPICPSHSPPGAVHPVGQAGHQVSADGETIVPTDYQLHPIPPLFTTLLRSPPGVITIRPVRQAGHQVSADGDRDDRADARDEDGLDPLHTRYYWPRVGPKAAPVEHLHSQVHTTQGGVEADEARAGEEVRVLLTMYVPCCVLHAVCCMLCVA
ncbi:unnamed protein product [Closterium sp. NIES-53]